MKKVLSERREKERMSTECGLVEGYTVAAGQARSNEGGVENRYLGYIPEVNCSASEAFWKTVSSPVHGIAWSEEN
uniref:Uncharacterized protein n=1 Tax=Caenorhabditis japonica TaxID=281687 RepID=A0A8R1ISX3_CAEJA